MTGGENTAASTVLVVDDEPALAQSVAATLRTAGWQVVTAADGRSAMEAAAAVHPDLIVLDLGLPDLPGTEVLTGLRGATTVPIVALSADPDIATKNEALGLGADDYVVKPFEMDDLMARLRAVVRRSNGSPPTVSLVEVGDLVIDLGRKLVTRAGVEVALTETEWCFLELLARNLGRVLSREQILREVWGPGFERETHYLRVYAAQLRRKIEVKPSQPRHLITSSGLGYVLEA